MCRTTSASPLPNISSRWRGCIRSRKNLPRRTGSPRSGSTLTGSLRSTASRSSREAVSTEARNSSLTNAHSTTTIRMPPSYILTMAHLRSSASTTVAPTTDGRISGCISTRRPTPAGTGRNTATRDSITVQGSRRWWSASRRMSGARNGRRWGTTRGKTSPPSSASRRVSTTLTSGSEASPLVNSPCFPDCPGRASPPS